MNDGRFIEVPHRMLPGETLDALLEAFVTRQGYDTTDTGEGMHGWVAALKRQLERGELIVKKYVNVGVAVDTDRGLLVPVIRNADRKNIWDISVEINQPIIGGCFEIRRIHQLGWNVVEIAKAQIISGIAVSIAETISASWETFFWAETCWSKPPVSR